MGFGIIDRAFADIDELFGETHAEEFSADSVSTDELSITGGENVTINVPSDSPTVHDAVKRSATIVPNGDISVTVNIESGHVIEQAIAAHEVNLGHVTITSEDATVSIGDISNEAILEVQYGVAPKWDVLVEGDGTEHGLWISRGAIGWVTPDGGATNVDEGLVVNRQAHVYCEQAATFTDSSRGINVTQAGSVTARNCDCTGNTEYGIRSGGGAVVNATGTDVSGADTGVRCTNRSYVQINDGTADNCAAAISATTNGTVNGENLTADGISNTVVSINTSGTVHGDGMTATGVSGGGAVVESGGELVAHNADFSGATLIGVDVKRGRVDVQGADLSDCGDHGLRARFGASVIATNADVSGASLEDVLVAGGPRVTLHGATTTSGSPDVGDTNLSAFNDPVSDGIIYA